MLDFDQAWVVSDETVGLIGLKPVTKSKLILSRIVSLSSRVSELGKGAVLTYFTTGSFPDSPGVSRSGVN